MPRQTSIHCWYCVILYLLYECICVLVCILCLLWSIAEAVSSGSWPILFKVLMLNVAICIVLLHFSNFRLSSVADFLNTGARTHLFLFTSAKSDAVWTSGLSMSYDNLLMVVFLFSSIETTLIDVVVPQLNYLILGVIPWDSSAQHLVRHAIDMLLGLSPFMFTMLLPMASEVYLIYIYISPSCMY